MPETIGNHGLYCPEFDDYAAVALYMQDLGTRIDAALGEQLDQLNDFLQHPTIIVTNAVNKTIVSPGVNSAVFDTVLFNNSTFMSYDLVNNRVDVGSAVGVNPVVPYRRGAYTTGVCMRMTAAGGVTVASPRDVILSIHDGENTDIFTATVQYRDSIIDMNTGGDEGVLAEANFLRTGITGTSVSAQAISSNAASNTTVLAGALLWVTYNGPTDIIEVA